MEISMNNISAFPSHIEYPTIDVAILQQARKEARGASIEVQVLFAKTDYLEALHSRVTNVDNAMAAAQFKLTETAQSLDMNITAFIETLRIYQSELEEVPGSERQEVLEDIAKVVSDILSTVRKEKSTLDSTYTPMTAAIDRTETGKFLVQMAVDMQRLPDDVLDIEQRKQALSVKRDTLTQAMTVIESKGFAEIGKETLLNAQAISTLTTAGPEAAILTTAIELAQQTMQKVESFISYNGMREARNVIGKQMEVLTQSIQDKNTELRMVEMKAELIKKSHTFEEQRLRYTAEFSKVSAAAQSFVTTYRAVDAQNEAVVGQFVVDAQQLARYMNALT